MGAMKLGVQERSLDGANLEEKWRFATDLGFDGIELRAGPEITDRLDELKRARDAGVVMPSVCLAAPPFIGDFDPEKRRVAVRTMKTLLSVIVEAGGFGAITPASFGIFSRRLSKSEPPRSEAEDREVLLEALAELGDHARKVGGVVLLEPLNRYEDYMVNTLADAASLIHELGLPSVKLMADTFHMNIEETDPADSLRRHADVLGHVQVADSNRLEPGAGHYDWKGTLAALEGMGYEGWMVLECRTLSGPPGVALPPVPAVLGARG
ncbi:MULTISPECIES: sugar phosphate isomerase/epimerase family protein [Streptomyces]|uniref:sugar phosphate isomerase/epimerase family protein n=1 Tax=Streptomyces TaxID=1883 RepID=UPI00081B591E|nr:MULTISPECIES: sugar phosphate isomerase/epimerase [unclassified Streptomyces]SCD97748.1 Sugar phosphate isomerase/epimerase [Streptomyces sp. Termitarium-T10T-6]